MGLLAGGLAQGQTTITIGGVGAANDVTLASSWTTDNVVYDGSNGGLTMNWENVLTNTGVADVSDNFFNVNWGTNVNYTIARVYLYNHTEVDLATLEVEGITNLAWDVDLESSSTAFDNWFPIIAVTDGGTTTYYAYTTGSNSWHGNAPHDFNKFANLHKGGTWGRMLPTSTGRGDAQDGADNPVLNREYIDYDTGSGWVLGGAPLTGTVRFGFGQWGGSTGGSVADPTAFTTGIDAFEVVVTSDLSTAPPNPDAYIGGGTANATPDATDITNWTTNDVTYIQDAMLGVDDGYALNWDDVVQNSAIPNSTTHWDCIWQANPSYQIGHIHMYTAESIDLSTLASGITRLGFNVDMDSTAFTNWAPVMAITDGGVTRFYMSSKPFSERNNASLTDQRWKGNAPFTYYYHDEIMSGSDWAGINPTANGYDTARDLAVTPVLRGEYVWNIGTQMFDLVGTPTGVVTFGFFQWGGTSGSGDIDPAVAFTTAIDKFEVFAYTDAGDITVPPTPVGLTAGELASNDFDYRYELDVEANTLDIDGNLADDWRGDWEPSNNSSIPGVALNDNTNANNLFRTDQTDTINRGTGGLAVPPGDFTLEVRLRVKEKLGGYAATAIIGNNPGAAGSIRYIIDEANVALNQADDIVVTGDNTDAFHTYRIAWVAADNKYWLWRDDVLIYGGTTIPGGGIDPTNGTLSSAGAFWIGDFTGGFAGLIEYDYIRLHPAAVTPVSTAWTGTSDGNWDASTTNFDQGSGAVAYTNGEHVHFPDVGTTSALTLSGTIEPDSIAFENTGGGSAYSLSGVGISGLNTSLSVIGGGAVTLNNVNTYTGVTEVAVGSLTVASGAALGDTSTIVRDGGTLTIDSGGSSGASWTTVQSGGTLMNNGVYGDGSFPLDFTAEAGGTISGSGVYDGDLVVAGTIAPGASVGTLSGIFVTLVEGSSYEWEVSKWLSGVAGTDHDLLTSSDETEILATSTPGEELTIVIMPDSIPVFDNSDQTFVIATADLGLTVIDSDAFIVDDSAFKAAHPSATKSWLVQQNGDDLELVYTASDYDTWIDGFFSGETDSAIIGGSADPDGDGVDNDGEYAFGLNPDDASSVSPYDTELVGTGFSYTRRDPLLTGLTYSIETSTDLVTWGVDGGAVQTPGATDGNGNHVVTVTGITTAPVDGKLFVRVTAAP